MAVIAVDMTPMLPGGKNGGAKIVALELLRSFRTIASGDRFLILTASWNHEELTILDGPNMTRVCILKREEPAPKPSNARYPGRLKRGLSKIYRGLRRKLQSGQILRRPLASRGVDLLFCPFTALTYAEPGMPLVSVIHDLQHRDYPQFFSSYEIEQRDSFLVDVSRRAAAIICVSDYTRRSAVKYLRIPPERTYTVHNCIQTRLNNPEAKKVPAHLGTLGISGRRYMFYPANFWPHKNHRMLLTSYGMFLSRNPDQEIDLVFTGALDNLQEELKEACKQMGLANRVHFLGFLPEDQIAAVWEGCEILIFPSLYEGFGIPVLEAMSFGKPVLCSNVAGLPEVAGEAALYFDPRKPGDIARCIERLVCDESLAAGLISKGRRRVVDFQPEDMSRRYLEIFHSAINDPGRIATGVTGVYEDGWTGEEIVVTFASGSGRVLEIRLEAPSWLPHGKVKARLAGTNGTLQRYGILRGEEITIRYPLPEQKGCMTLAVTPTFVPSQHDMGDDSRSLGVMCRGCWIISSEQERESLLKGEG